MSLRIIQGSVQFKSVVRVDKKFRLNLGKGSVDRWAGG